MAVPKAALAQLSTSCTNAPTCYSGTATNVPIEANTTGSPGANANGWDFYSSANLTSTAIGVPRLIDISSNGGDGNPNGGSSGAVTVSNVGTLAYAATPAANFTLTPLALFSIETRGGNGASSSGFDNGGIGGDSSVATLSITNNGTITANGNAWLGAAGLHAYDIAGNGGSYTAVTNNYFGGNGGDANSHTVFLTNAGAISLGTASSLLTGGFAAVGIDVRSQGGDGGDGACSNVGVLLANNNIACPKGDKDHAGNGGAGGTIQVSNTAPISIYWNAQTGIFPPPANLLIGISAVSIGGNGGDSRSNFASGGLGGQASSVVITNTQSITLSATGSLPVQGAAIYAHAQGGQGGTGNEQDSNGNGVGGAGGSVTASAEVQNQLLSVYVSHGGNGLISTTGNQIAGIVALARGGTGGAGGSDWASNNSSGGAGGAAGAVLVAIGDAAQVSTTGQSASGVLAQSIGGIGGNGGNDGGLVGQNGGAGMGGAGGSAAVTASAGTRVQTAGDYSVGIGAQSIGGGGGSGSDFTGVLGGQGGQGGRGGDSCAGCAGTFSTQIQTLGTVITSGDHSYGLLAQAIGGAGGVGGIADGLVYALGGAGGAGGSGSGVSVDSGGTVQTSGYGSHGILAQSIGGGGGAAGVSSGAISIGGDGAIAYAAPGGQVMVTQTGLVQTSGNAAAGLVAQSIGGGGGSGAGSKGIISVGGTGSAGGDGSSVQVGVNGGIRTAGHYSFGVLAQSIGGGGGSGGDVLDYSVGIPTAGVGGSSAGGGTGGAVTIDFGGSVATGGNHAAGLVAQSIGGGGGTAGDVNGTGLFAFATLTIGGGASSAGGGAGGNVTVDTSGAGTPMVQTAGAFGTGVLAQSIGGGGGNGGNAAGIDVNGIFAAGVAVGGDGGAGGNGGSVSVNWQGGGITTGATMKALSTAAYQPISLTGQAGNAYGLVAQSIGGGGGTGGSSTVDQLVLSIPTTDYTPFPTVNLTSSVGGTAGSGGSGGVVDVGIAGTSIITWGAGAHAVLAQSIGGGGGAGGDASSISVAAAIPETSEMPTFSVSASAGGSGGSGGSGQTVTVDVDQSVLTTYGDNANAIVAQSIGGGGGDGGIGSAATFTLSRDHR